MNTLIREKLSANKVSHINELVHSVMNRCLALFAYRFQSRHGEMPVVRQRKHFEKKAEELIRNFLVPQELAADHSIVISFLDTVQHSILDHECFKFIIILRDRSIPCRILIETVKRLYPAGR